MDKYELANKIFQKALEIDRTTKHDVFVNFSGHVKGISVEIYKNGWKEDADFDYYKSVYLDFENSEEELQNILDYLNELEENK